jgi:hypothetical protein
MDWLQTHSIKLLYTTINGPSSYFVEYLINQINPKLCDLFKEYNVTLGLHYKRLPSDARSSELMIFWRPLISYYIDGEISILDEDIVEEYHSRESRDLTLVPDHSVNIVDTNLDITITQQFRKLTVSMNLIEEWVGESIENLVKLDKNQSRANDISIYAADVLVYMALGIRYTNNNTYRCYPELGVIIHSSRDSFQSIILHTELQLPVGK